METDFSKLKSALKTFLFLMILLYMLFVFVASIDNIDLTWRPKELFEEYEYIKNSLNKKMPQISSSSPLLLKQLVDEPFIPAVQLIQQDLEFKYLIDMMMKYKIEIRSDPTISGLKEGEYRSECPPSGNIYLNPHLSEVKTNYLYGPAMIIVHELTHAQLRIKYPQKYCHKKLLSDEFLAFKNAFTFKHKYKKFDFTDYFDRNGVFHEYCLYKNIKNGYSGWIDDINLQPKSKMEQFWCIFTTNL